MRHIAGLPVWLAVSLAVVAALGLSGAAVVDAGPAQLPALQAATCSWQGIGNATRAVYYAAAAMDTDNHHMYVYGGLDQALATQNLVQRIDLSGTSPSPAAHGTLSGVPALKRFGAAAAYRSRGDESMVLFLGGSADVLDGAGTDTIQAYNVTTKQWLTLSATGTFEGRMMHAAAYDPEHDVVWVTGGIRRCGLADAASGNCPARSLATRYLAFDPTSGAASWQQHSGTGPNQVYGHTMVYDPAGKRLLAFGGTRDGRVGSNDVWQLDLTDADPAAATWSTLSTTGATVPRTALHAAALDADRNWMVVYGGVTSNFNASNENTPTSTYALDLGVNPPAWVDLGASLQQRVGAAMAYSDRHRGVILNGGRRAAKAQPPQDVQRDSSILGCSDQPTVVPPPATAPPAPTTPTTEPPTSLPPPATAVPPVPTQPTQPPSSAQVCSFAQRFNRVPPAALAAAMANPASVSGWGKRCHEGVPASAANPERRFLSIHNINKPYHPLYNGLVFRCGCP